MRLSDFIIIGVLFASSANAEWSDVTTGLKEADYSFILTIGSKHWSGRRAEESGKDGYNESNEGFGVNARFENGYRVGFLLYENSYWDTAFVPYVGKNYYEGDYLHLGWNVGYGFGYEDHTSGPPIFPVLTATVIPAPEQRYVPHVIMFGFPGAVIGFGLGWDIE